MIARFALKRVWQVFTRLRVAALLIFALLVLAALGSCFPQLSAPVATEGERLQAWGAAVQSRFGGLTGALAAVGLFDWFHSPLFLLSLALLALATLVCTLNRWSSIWRQTVRRPEFPSDLAFEAAPYMANWDSGARADPAIVLRRSLEARGFHVQTRSVEDRYYVRGDRNRWAYAATLLTHTAVLLLLSGGVLSGGLGWREPLTLEPGATAEVGRGSALALSNQGFAITRYPDGSVAGYQAQVAVLDQGRQIARGSIEVNAPLTYRGLAFYLNGYDPRGDTGYSLTLLAVRDPGYGLVIAAGFALLLSLAVSFNFPRCWIQARVEAGGAVTLAGWAERHAWEFEREFEALVQSLGGRKAGRAADDGAGRRWLAWAAGAVALVGWGLLTVSLVRRGLVAGHWPLTNRYEFALCWVWAILAIYLLLAAGRLRGRMVAFPIHGSVGVLAVASLVAVYALTRSPEQRAVAPLLPALRSPWLQIHVLSTLVGYAACGVAAGLGLTLLIRRGPTGDHLTRTMERSVALGFPWLTLGILTGAIWAQNAWGRYWGWDPKETWALVTWLWYLLVLHLRPLPGWRGRRLAGLVMVGFGMVLFTFIGVPWLVRLVRLESLHGF